MGGAVKKLTANPIRTLANVGTFGTYELGRKMLPGITNPLERFGRNITGQGGEGNTTGGLSESASFGISPEELAANQSAVTGLGEKQYAEKQKSLMGPGGLADLLSEQARNSFSRTLPDMAESAQARHLYDSTGYGQEVARLQSNLAADISNRLGQESLGALSQKQGLEQSGLSRKFSLEDFIRQANVAKTIGAQTAPTVPSGKASGLAGGVAGAGAGAPFGPWGAGIGGTLGLLMGSQANKKGK